MPGGGDALTAPDTGQPTEQPATSGDRRLAGTLGGLRWNITSADDATTSLSLNLDGRIPTIVGGAPRPVVFTWEVNFKGLGEHGVLLYGLAPADIASIHLQLDEVTIALPVTHDTNGVTIFAIPIPPGLILRSIELLDTVGQPRHSTTPPRFVTPTAGSSATMGRPFGTTTNEPLTPTLEGPPAEPTTPG